MKNHTYKTWIMAAFLVVALVAAGFAETIRQGGERISFNTLGILTKTSAYTVTTSDAGKQVNVNATSAAVTITLPTVRSMTVIGNNSLMVKKTDASANAVTITPATGDTIGGESTRVLLYQNAYAVISTGPNNDWVVNFESPYIVEDYESGTVATYGAGTLTGDQVISGTTPTLTIGDGGAEDGAVIFDTDAAAGSSFHVGYDDSADSLRIGVGETLGTDHRITISNATTSTAVVIGDAAAEDMQVRFDGNAQDFHIGLDDSVDDLVIGVGSALGTTTAIAIDENQNVTLSSAVLFPQESVTATNVLTINECGKTFLLNNATTEFASTLPTASTVPAGCRWRFIIKAAPSGASYTLVTGNTLENKMYGSIHNGTGVDTQAAGDTITFVDGAAVVGDWVDVEGDGTNFYVNGFSGADTGITYAQAD